MVPERSHPQRQVRSQEFGSDSAGNYCAIRRASCSSGKATCTATRCSVLRTKFEALVSRKRQDHLHKKKLKRV